MSRHAPLCGRRWIGRLLCGGLLFGAANLAAQPARLPDTTAQRLVACTTCHGPQGRAAADGFHPRLAGKPAGYLEAQLRHFRDGRRHYGPMATLLQGLPDTYLHEMAAHFAAQSVPYPPPVRSDASTEVLARGRQLALQGDALRGVPACAACHGARLMGVQPATPALLGLPRDYLLAQMGAWVNGQRRAAAPDCMAEVVRRLAPADIAAASAWLAAQPVPLPATADAALPAPAPLRCGVLP